MWGRELHPPPPSPHLSVPTVAPACGSPAALLPSQPQRRAAAHVPGAGWRGAGALPPRAQPGRQQPRLSPAAHGPPDADVEVSVVLGAQVQVGRGRPLLVTSLAGHCPEQAVAASACCLHLLGLTDWAPLWAGSGGCRGEPAGRPWQVQWPEGQGAALAHCRPEGMVRDDLLEEKVASLDPKTFKTQRPLARGT